MKKFIQQLEDEPRWVQFLMDNIVMDLAFGRGSATFPDQAICEKEIEWLKDHGFTVKYDQDMGEYEITWH